jgi:hypothetical protein
MEEENFGKLKTGTQRRILMTLITKILTIL